MNGAALHIPLNRFKIAALCEILEIERFHGLNFVCKICKFAAKCCSVKVTIRTDAFIDCRNGCIYGLCIEAFAYVNENFSAERSIGRCPCLKEFLFTNLIFIAFMPCKKHNCLIIHRASSHSHMPVHEALKL